MKYPVDMDQEDQVPSETAILVSLYVFGEKIQDVSFRDAVIDALVHAVSTPDKEGRLWYPSGSTISAAYEGTPSGSPLRKLLVDFFVFHGGSDWIGENDSGEFHVELLRELLPNRTRSSSEDPTRPGASLCRYHCHAAEDACSGKK